MPAKGCGRNRRYARHRSPTDRDGMSGTNATCRRQFSIRLAAIIKPETGVASDGNRCTPNQQTKSSQSSQKFRHVEFLLNALEDSEPPLIRKK